jgi:hypothetical protein
VRELSRFTRPSKASEVEFNLAVDQVAQAARELLHAVVTNGPKRDRAVEAAAEAQGSSGGALPHCFGGHAMTAKWPHIKFAPAVHVCERLGRRALAASLLESQLQWEHQRPTADQESNFR